MVRNTSITRNATRITLTGPRLADFVPGGPDQRVKLFVPREGRPASRITRDDLTWREAWTRIPEADRPYQRTYTVRAHRSNPVEIDIDFALHAPGGPACRWARSARTGDAIELLGPTAERNGGYSFEPPAGRRLLLAGDHAALPAIGSIVESLPRDARGHVFVEVGSAADRQHLAAPPGVRVDWVHRGDAPVAENRLLDAIRAAHLPVDHGYAWLAGEAGRVRALRRHLKDERGMDHRSIAFMGYWRVGHTEETAHTEPTGRVKSAQPMRLAR
ncbi:siderophore-interacting protein [Embleya sp. NPDC005575]|uniref:siderophore-interacting protein n=1 Tax=Embleya sp. NPDC005575 TaxID=3156892 RepID=UPI0033B4D4DA